MQFTQHSTTLLTDDVPASRDFHTRHFGWRVTSDAGFFVSLRHGEQPYELCVMQREHAVVPEGFRTSAAGLILAYLVEDAAAQAERLVGEGVGLLTPVTDEPYGQRHFFVADPGGVLIDIVEPIAPDPAWLAAHGMAADGSPAS